MDFYKNWYVITSWPKVLHGVFPSYSNKYWAGLNCARRGLGHLKGAASTQKPFKGPRPIGGSFWRELWRALSSPMRGPPCKSWRLFKSTLKFGWWPDLVDLSLGGVLQLLPRHFGDPLMTNRFRTTRAFFFLVFLVFLEVRDCLLIQVATRCRENSQQTAAKAYRSCCHVLDSLLSQAARL